MTVRELYEKIGGDYDNLSLRIPTEELIKRFIVKFANTTETDQMISAFEEKNYKKVFEYSHTLKGMAANLSLNRINDNISSICEEVRNGDPVNDLTERINQAKADHEELFRLVSQLA